MPEFITNLDLLSVGIAVAGTGILGFVIFFSNTKSITNRAFLALSLITIFWGTVNYLNYQTTDPDLILWLLRFVLFFAVWQAYTLFLFFYVFPEEKFEFSRKYRLILTPLVVLTSLLTLTPLVFSGLAELSTIGEVSKVNTGPGILLFGLVSVGLVIAGIRKLAQKIKKATNKSRNSLLIVLAGTVITFSFIIIFNFLVPVLTGNRSLIPLGAVFFFPFIIFTSYAIYRYSLLNARVIGAEILTFVLAIVAFAEVIFAQESTLIIYRSVVFVLILIFGILLIRGVLKEVQQREEIEILAKDLERANIRLKELDKLKSEFVSIASHQLRSPLTSVKGYASLILEGSFGKVSDAVKEAVQRIFDASQTMVNSVEDFLNVSRIEQGRMKYELSVFDAGELAEKVIEENRPVADKKKLKLSYRADVKENTVRADIGKIKQVINNLVDNAIKYTEKGSIEVNVSRHENMLRIAVHDTGVGISAETLPRLFDRFVRDKDARKVNVSGSGLGLYVAKQLVEGHKGKIWAESEGEGKGSTFIVELPTK